MFGSNGTARRKNVKIWSIRRPIEHKLIASNIFGVVTRCTVSKKRFICTYFLKKSFLDRPTKAC